MRWTTVCLWLGLVSTLAADDNVLLVKDMRAKGSTSTYSVVLAARRGPVGHAMVVLGKEDEKKLVSSFEAFGFYPEKGLGVLGPVPGMVANELIQGKGITTITTRVILNVEKEQYDKINKIRQQWLTKKYRVIQNDCVTFTNEVAEALGLKTPKRGDAILPVTFIEKIAELNK